MLIYQLVYELYKIDWMRRISADRQMDALKDYYEHLESDWYYLNDRETIMSFDKYICEFGYDGEIYVCLEEFYNNEYLDRDYVKQLLGNDKLYAEYEEHLKHREFYSHWN